MNYLSDAELTQLKADYPELHTDSCPTCHDRGSYRWQGEQQQCVCSAQKRLFVRYLQAGIGSPYQRLSWTDLHVPENQLAPVIDYLDNAEAYLDRGLGLLFTGPKGAGKTMLAMLVLKELVKQDYFCYATTFSSTVDQFTAGWRNDNDKERFARRFMQSKVLVLDDLGKEFSNKLSSTTFDNILRTRVQNARPTILTTNLTAQQVERGYGSAVLSLLFEQSIEVPLTGVGADFRAQAYQRHRDEVKREEVRPIV